MLINRDKRAGLRHWQIAEKIGVSTGNITHWLNKSVKPDADSLLKISLAYGIQFGSALDQTWLKKNARRDAGQSGRRWDVVAGIRGRRFYRISMTS